MPRSRKKHIRPLDPPRKQEDARTVAWLTLRREEKRTPTPDSEMRSAQAQDAQETLGQMAEQAGLEPRDRAFAFEIVQGVLRLRRLLDAALDRVEGFTAKTVTPEIRDLLRVGAYQYFRMNRVPVHAIVHETVEVASVRLGKRKAGFCNAFLQRMAAAYPNREADLEQLKKNLEIEVRHSFPGWLVRLIRRLTGDQRLETALETLNRPLPIYARSNPRVASLEETVRVLSKAGIAARPRSDLAPLCMELETPAGIVAETDFFRKGGLFIQDASAQMISEFACAMLPRHREDLTIIDLCAAPGGKITYLAAQKPDHSRIIACDVSASRLERLRENVERLGLARQVEIALLVPTSRGIPHDTSALPQADFILADVPCSGLGTLRRHPEIRWRLRHADLRRLADLQSGILDRAARWIAPAGRLLYSTCSLAPEENEEVVQKFLERHPGQFRMVKETENLPECVAARISEDGWLRTLPLRDNTDSACAVCLEKTSS